jgi:hypothetical protein
MTLFAPVCPPRIYRELFRTPRARGNYFLLLAHDVLKNPAEYAALFHNHSNTDFIHMDNSVVELGDSVTMQMIWDAAETVSADTLVLPDVYCKSKETVDSTLRGFDDFLNLQVEARGQSKARAPLIIPQGESMKQWAWCLETLTQKIGADRIPWVGIPRNITGRISPSRLEALLITKIVVPNARIHLMGFSDDFIDDIRCALNPVVTGIDSAVPVRCPTEFTLSCDPGPRGDWWDHGNYAPLVARNVIKVRDMIFDPSGALSHLDILGALAGGRQ